MNTRQDRLFTAVWLSVRAVRRNTEAVRELPTRSPFRRLWLSASRSALANRFAFPFD
jgi:hypothetical protein